MATIVGPPARAIRNRPIAPELERVLRAAADTVGVDTINIVSGGQPTREEGGPRTGSTRHDHGRAADLQLVIAGRTLTFTDDGADARVAAFVTAAAASGATGIGAGVAYMGNKTIHVGFGTSVDDRTRLVWGAGGKSATAPDWLRIAARKGWDGAASPLVPSAEVAAPGRFAVIARDGLKLRNGPGTTFESARTLPAGTELTVMGFDGGNDAWARVDLEDDGLLDGHVFAAFLAPSDGVLNGREDAAEPDAGMA